MSTTRSKPVAFFESDLPRVKGRQLGFAMTSKEPNYCVTCIVTCEDQWSIMQMEALEKMGEEVDGEIGLIFIEDAVRRAKRAAGNYALLFLNDEGTDKEGRFYWPGLAAFAAKQVADGMETARKFYSTESRSAFEAVRYAAAVTYYYLAKGNLWLFLEVVPWHLFYRQYGVKSFNIASSDATSRPTTRRSSECFSSSRGRRDRSTACCMSSGSMWQRKTLIMRTSVCP